MSSEQPGPVPDTESNTPPQSGELDDFGLPIRPKNERTSSEDSNPGSPDFHDAEETPVPVDITLTEAQHDPAATTSDYTEANKGENNEAHVDEAPSPAPITGLGVTIESNNDSELKEIQGPAVDTPVAEGQVAGRKEGRHSHSKNDSMGASEWSHQKLTEQHSDEESDSEDEWKAMPALGEMDHYDDYGRLVAKGSKLDEDDFMEPTAASRGYTRIQLDDDVVSVTSMDENSSYLFKEGGTSVGVDDDTRDALSQLQATKNLLSEGQRIAYVGVVRLAIYQMTNDLGNIRATKSSKKALLEALDSMKKWGQGIMIRIFAHMDIDSAEQVMIEQLTEHGVQSADLVAPLMKNSRVKNPMAEEGRSSLGSSSLSSPNPENEKRNSPFIPPSFSPPPYGESTSPPPYAAETDEVPGIQTPSQMPTSANIEIDLRWTVLCDLFLVLISDANYDARSRYLLEQVGKAMNISWMQICRFEKKVIDALEMEQAAEKENWDESEHMEQRRKQALKKKYMVMGLATVGGGLVIGLSAGLLAPVIGAGLAAGFTTIGISGTGAFLGGTGGTALIASGATLTGTYSGLRASHRRTGAVQTFEYRPLHNNQRVNLIVTVAGWMTGKVDDVRLPFSTVDPIMGDLYSVFWEPDMLQSMGSTINILATEVKNLSTM
jgi:Protein of unknown function (DUF726)